MSNVTEGRPVQRHELHGLDPLAVAKMLGHNLSRGGGVSIEPDVVIVHVGKRKPRHVRHQIGG